MELLAQMKVAETYLSDKARECSFDEIINYLSIQNADPTKLQTFRMVMQRNAPSDKIAYNKEGDNGNGTYKYRSIYPIHNAEDLRAYLQNRTHAIGIKVDELKDGWKDCVPIINTMGGTGELLVVKDKMNRPKTVWQDDKTLTKEIDRSGIIQSEWHAIKIPLDTEELRNKLIAAGQNPSSAARRVVAAKPQAKKRKAARRGGRTTNVHMTSVLKDYSGSRA